ncbi:MAG: hypothetical protein OEP48_14585 [Betaproteobacteria bacterium]|nr:hypothetical protein [Betaproteobacteria bacterium]
MFKVPFRSFALPGRFLALLLAAGTPALADEEIRVIETRSIPIEQVPVANGASHEFRLSLYTFSGTRWSGEEIEAAALKGAGLLAQCGVALSGAELRVVEAPRRYRSYYTPVSRELLQRIKVHKPAIFFVDDTHNNPAFEAEAIGRKNARTQPELADTVWVAHGARDLPQTLAHELVHVLSNDGGHSNEPGNLMRAHTSWRNTHLTDTQCVRLRSRGEANGLLAARPSAPR